MIKTPRDIILEGLDESKELYIKLKKIFLHDPELSKKIEASSEDIESFKNEIRKLKPKELQDLLKRSI